MSPTLLSVLLNVVDGVLHSLNGLSLIVRDGNAKLFLKLHNEALQCRVSQAQGHW